MKTTLSFIALFLITLTARCQEPLGEYKWHDLAQSGNLPMGTVATIDGREVLKIENTNAARLQVTLLTIPKPKITANIYEITGEVRYDSVEDDGYLELMNYFPPVKPGLPQGQYFSRTLAASGPMAKLSGTSGWREFVLPFDRMGVTNSPESLRVNLVLPGNGTVYLGQMSLSQLPRAQSAAVALYKHLWWPPAACGTIFGWGGAFVGCLGGLCGFLAQKGRSYNLVMGIFGFLITLGVLTCLAGAAAAGLGQPVFVWLPLLGTGVLLLLICPFNMRQIRRNYAIIELRRMAAIDAGASFSHPRA